jgi:hypothetical protein
VNSTNLFDGACGFGGYRESGYGREGGKEGLIEYLEPTWFKTSACDSPASFSGKQDRVERVSRSSNAWERSPRLTEP